VRTLAVLAGAATATVLLAGCGQIDSPGAAGPAPAATKAATAELASMPAKDVVAKTGAALRQAGTVRVTGTFVSAGQPAVLDLKIKGNQGATGTIKVRGATLSMLSNGSNAYLKSSTAGWTALGAGAGAPMLADKWVKVASTDPDFVQLADFTRLDKLAALFLTEDISGVKIARTTYNGRQVVKLSDRAGSLLVAATGTPYPVKVVQLATAAGQDAGSIEFSDFGKPVSLVEPAEDEIIDTTGLTG
jgi:hypothetical protein